MTPLLANVSFGILAFTPYGWAFMTAIILIEWLVLSRVTARRWWSRGAGWAAFLANAISGLLGFGISLWLNGGWWLVVWMPWVSRNEVDWANPTTRQLLVLYSAVAFVLSVVIEVAVERFILGEQASRCRVWGGCLLGNVLSYLLGGLALYSVGFGSLF
ncbi:MAG TPA: hypothetical protein VK163_02280 [Opitutaceae bacterium]|nr:hypothetical protein [Opitutaceae bacterium]